MFYPLDFFRNITYHNDMNGKPTDIEPPIITPITKSPSERIHELAARALDQLEQISTSLPPDVLASALVSLKRLDTSRRIEELLYSFKQLVNELSESVVEDLQSSLTMLPELIQQLKEEVLNENDTDMDEYIQSMCKQLHKRGRKRKH